MEADVPRALLAGVVWLAKCQASERPCLQWKWTVSEEQQPLLSSDLHTHGTYMLDSAYFWFLIFKITEAQPAESMQIFQNLKKYEIQNT